MNNNIPMFIYDPWQDSEFTEMENGIYIPKKSKVKAQKRAAKKKRTKKLKKWH